MSEVTRLNGRIRYSVESAAVAGSSCSMPCPNCGAETGSSDSVAFCPQCLIAGALETSATGSFVDTETETQLLSEVSNEDSFGRYRILRMLGEGGMGTSRAL